MEKKHNIYKGFIEGLGNIFKDLLDSTVKVWLEQRYLTRLISDLYGFGLDGGPFNSRLAGEIVVNEDEIIGLRHYDPETEEPLRRTDQITGFDDEGKIKGYTSGKLVKLSLELYDLDFTELGSAKRLTNGDYTDLEDTNTIHKEFINDALRYYVKFAKKRGKPLITPSGVPSNIYVIDIPTTKSFGQILSELLRSGNFIRAYKDLKEGFDWELAKYFTIQAITYKIFDTLLFDPFVEKPLKKLREKMGPAGKRLIDPFIVSEYTAVTGLVNKLYGLPEKEYVTL